MTGLQTFWTWLLGLSVLLFFFVEVVVVIGGARDIRDMLRSLMQHAAQERAKGEAAGGRTSGAPS